MPRPSSAFFSRPHPHLYEINTWVWLNTLSRKAKRTIKLGDVPDREWDSLQAKGFDGIWLMGLWERSARSAQIARNHQDLRKEYDQALPGWLETDVVGSPYAVRAYRPDPELASWDDLANVLGKLHDRGMKLILDFVPNHTALDHEWVTQHPEYYIQGTVQDAIDFPSSFFPVETSKGLPYVAHGKDPHFPAWTDTAQLNYFNPDTRTALLQELQNISHYCDGVRCDMAMLVLNEVFAQTWGKHMQGLSAPSQEFWTEAIARLSDFMWVAEVYWDREWELQQLGFHFTYDKRLYDRLRHAQPQEIVRHLNADVTFQNKLVRFLENHDEPRSAVVFGNSRLPAVGVLMATLPGMRLYHQGQFEGKRIRIPVQLARAREEPPDVETRDWYERLLHITDESVFHFGQWQQLLMCAAEGSSSENLIAYEWKLPSVQMVVVVNLGSRVARVNIRIIDDVLASLDSAFTTTYTFCERLTDAQVQGKYEDLRHHGLSVELAPNAASIFSRAL